ncbi:glycosyl transferase [Halomonas sp. ISL-60]|uniref:GH36-type glycosyl hydrolase domain-containing protein n=1 Tax=Halomonas sp. ISL-56 TaxID=2819149 RepID=UPI001BE7A08E|nr:glucoamylase family protein [Halomonas sp. ISL-56]MBT2771539.1 glycosyl transferase [Halomonas sp. ISL-60]MBT2801396.1 glycosyl transferase [Halomonas sp. ISL-56]
MESVKHLLRFVRPHPTFAAPWNATAPVREELFSAERLEQHAGSLALRQTVTRTPPNVVSLTRRLNDNAKTLLAVYRDSATALADGRDIVPAAAWLLDNYHLIEAQIREIRSDLPPGYYRQLPKLADGPFAGYPRVFGIAWAFVAHTDSHIDLENLQNFITAYQRTQPLTIGELWAVAITLRIVLIENLRRLADQISSEQTARDEADALATKWLTPTNQQTSQAHHAFHLETSTLNVYTGPLAEPFTAQLAKRLRGLDPRSSPLAGWLDEQLSHQGVTIDEMVQNAQQRQGAANVSVRNIITSMRFVSSIDWAELFESVSLVDKRLRQQSNFDQLDFPTRNQYRSAVEQLARSSQYSELEIVESTLCLSDQAVASNDDPIEAARLGDPGYFLIGSGRVTLEHQIGFKPSSRQRLRRTLIHHGIRSYIVMMAAVTLSLMLLAGVLLLSLPLVIGEMPLFWLMLLGVFGFLPIMEVATLIVNRLIIYSIDAQPLPGLDLSKGVPTQLRTLIAVPTLLTSEEDLHEQIERLEVHHLSSGEGALAYALLLDGVDASQAELAHEAALLSAAYAAVEQLNERYCLHALGSPNAPGSPQAQGSDKRFFLLYRRRVFNASENTWMGWERKRGKLHELNRLLRGATDTTFIDPPPLPRDVRYVITLDADTRLPRGAASRLIGKMAHPLNQPRMDLKLRRVVEGYAILQPRVTPSLPTGGEGSIYQRLFSAPGGIDPYAAAISDLYQDLVGEGSFAGKGIYDVDAFETSLVGRVPDNTLLSHDLFEGVFARAGLASDIEVIEDFPARYDVAAKRQHRWTRGDWQLLPWLIASALPLTGRLKMLGNLRRSVLPPFVLASLAVSWQLPLSMAVVSTLLLLAVVGAPILLSLAASFVPFRAWAKLRHHYHLWFDELKLGSVQILLLIIFLPDQAWRMLDAIARTLVRLLITHRRLLEWTSAAQSMKSPPLTVLGFYQRMAPGTALGLAVAISALWTASHTWPITLPMALLWLAAPAVASWLSSSTSVVVQPSISAEEAHELRAIARRTWRYFETFVTTTDSCLPPDNFQEDPQPALAQRTSPTNMGLYLLSTLAARDFGWIGTHETLERLEATLTVMQGLPRYRGHFYNWYATHDLRPLNPRYVSTVDSGNLAGHLIVIANACESWQATGYLADPRVGIADTLHLARQALKQVPTLQEKLAVQLSVQFEAIDAQLNGEVMSLECLANIAALMDSTLDEARTPLGAHSDAYSEDLQFWLEALQTSVAQHSHDRNPPPSLPKGAIALRLQQLADSARRLALGMDFAFLFNRERQLLSIGYSLDENCLDTSCYDLLASEARLASLFAIAKGDIPTRHWFRLGRAATPVTFGSALISWSGSMFEYLMPSLVMRAPGGSLLEQTNRLIVKRQETYAAQLSAPWGISESAYNARDMEFTYQYSNFGVPGLGLKRGLSADLVIAPYATGLAAMVDPSGACRNFKRLTEMGALGRYGFYEALDFTRSRLPAGESVVIVRSFMAHHQGMTIAAIANTLNYGQMRARFHREPMIQASELLLQERVPRNVAIAHPRAEEVKSTASQTINEAQTIRRASTTASGPPVTHLLSNGCYSVMLTATGGGYSRWRNVAISRWQPDATRDHLGSFIFLRDSKHPGVWTATGQTAAHPAEVNDDHSYAIFAEDYARYSHRHDDITSHMEVLVSGEDDSEVRHLSLTNNSRHARDITLTSYSELVLTSPNADNAHPAFAKMFVVTEYLEAFNALIATRRRRSPDEAQVWAAHFAVVEGDIIGELEFETDRAQFLGCGRSMLHASALAEGQHLSGSVGSVLDPIFALRYCLRVAPGKAARIAYWTVVAPSREALMDLIDKHHDRSAFERAKTLAWTQAQVQLRHLGIQPEEAADFQRLAAPILYPDARFRAPAEAIERGAGPQSRLWQHGISGDLPIILMRIDSIDDIGQVRQLLRAHEYWRMKRLGVDVVIINERSSSYIQDLQQAIETAVLSSQAQPRFKKDFAQGSVTTLRADLMSLEVRTQLQSIACVALMAHRGSIANQLALTLPVLRAPTPLHSLIKRPLPKHIPLNVSETPLPALEFFNGLGGFARDGREYVTVLEAGSSTPAPWINVIANAGFGFQVSAEGAGYVWADNSRENQLTAWSNDPVMDPSGDVIYVRDEESMALFTATARPLRDHGRYIARHGFGYSQFEHQADGITLALLHFVPLEAPLRISRLRLTNHSGRPRKLSVTAYAEWVLGTSRSGSAPFLISHPDADSGALLVENPWNMNFPGRVAFLDIGTHPTSWTADRCEFIGFGGSLAAPAGLRSHALFSGAHGAGLDPCAALNRSVTLAAGESVDIVVLMGQSSSTAEAKTLIARYREADIDAELAIVTAHWQTQLNAVQVTTPDRAMDIMLNGWLMYQTIACRITARSGFYQASGAYGFRDQLQDGMALTFTSPETTREHLLRAASRQFIEGDVQHWWLPHSGQGVRTRISDDRVWLAYACARYIATTHDAAVLDESVSFLEGAELAPGEHDSFFQPMMAAETASLFEHCARGLDQSIELTGELGLPLIGGGDWNDGMNRVGEAGKGESVWLGWLLLHTLELFLPFAQSREHSEPSAYKEPSAFKEPSAYKKPPASRAERWRAHATALRIALESNAWDGQWYRRATFDDGSWLGSKESDACQIDSIAQTWAVLSGAAEPHRAALAMHSLERELIKHDEQLALLFWPPFDQPQRDPGYISGYPPGMRENGGQYSHAAMWAILAFAKLGEGDKAHQLFSLLNPINHSRTPESAARYHVEPYVVAADVYSVAPHTGRGGWTWYTGSAGWMYRAGIEGILGIRREGGWLVIAPCLPHDWPGFSATLAIAATHYAVKVITTDKALNAQLDGCHLSLQQGEVRVPLDGQHHQLEVFIHRSHNPC